MGPYPLLALPRWPALGEDLVSLAGLVSVTAVCDPFGGYTASDLAATFDVVRPFKTHVIVNLRTLSPSRHHRRSAREALRRVHVEEVAEPASFVDEWCRLYAALVARLRIRGLHAFSARAFALQLAVPGVRVFRAVIDRTTVAAHVWYVAEGRAYSHLQAGTPDAYAAGASYALFAEAFERLRDVADRATIGGAAGGADEATDGLFQFKRGWSTETTTVPLVGRILDPVAYRRLADAAPATGYFPSYRAGELAVPSRMTG